MRNSFRLLFALLIALAAFAAGSTAASASPRTDCGDIVTLSLHSTPCAPPPTYCAGGQNVTFVPGVNLAEAADPEGDDGGYWHYVVTTHIGSATFTIAYNSNEDNAFLPGQTHNTVRTFVPVTSGPCAVPSAAPEVDSGYLFESPNFSDHMNVTLCSDWDFARAPWAGRGYTPRGQASNTHIITTKAGTTYGLMSKLQPGWSEVADTWVGIDGTVFFGKLDKTPCLYKLAVQNTSK